MAYQDNFHVTLVAFGMHVLYINAGVRLVCVTKHMHIFGVSVSGFEGDNLDYEKKK